MIAIGNSKYKNLYCNNQLCYDLKYFNEQRITYPKIVRTIKIQHDATLL